MSAKRPQPLAAVTVAKTLGTAGTGRRASGSSHSVGHKAAHYRRLQTADAVTNMLMHLTKASERPQMEWLM